MNSEEQYKYIDNKIKEASGKQEYAFSESSWDKMEALLDKKDDRKRPIFFISILLLLLSFLFGYYFFNKSQSGVMPIQTASTNKVLNNQLSNNKKTAIAVNQINDVNDKIKSGEKEQNDIDKNLNDQTISSAKIQQQNLHPTQKIFNKTSTGVLGENDIFSKVKRKMRHAKSNVKITQGEIDDDVKEINAKKKLIRSKASEKISIYSPDIETDNIITDTRNDNKTNNEPLVNNTNAKEVKDKIVNNKKDTLITKQTDSKPKISLNKKRTISSFYLLGSLGVDASSTKLFSYGQSPKTLRYGFDIGFRINKKMNIQAGFHASSKKYVAKASEYNIKSGSYLSTLKITGIEANCLVYEIPLSFQYNFFRKKNYAIFSGVGISSYIMKKEDYNYSYERYYRAYSIPYSYTGNKHFFASMNISTGIDVTLNKSFRIQAAPVINIPLSGVGEGNVKLFSSSLNIGIKYFPFVK
jgi:hypothetical protein